MIILDKPYVSEVMLKTIETLQIPILKNEMSEQFQDTYHLNIVEDEKFKQKYQEETKLYTNSENSLDWIYKNIEVDKKIETIHMFKNKAEFRNIVKDIYPDFFFKTLTYEELADFDVQTLPLPIILKPNQGFFSLGVYTIYQKSDWDFALKEIEMLVNADDNPFNEEVISHSEYIIEEYIKGEEYAVDGYYDDLGNVVILNILKHIFSSETDVSDRLYITSTEIIQTYFEPLETILRKVNSKSDIRNFPFHFEVRIDGKQIVPIEMNPLRFAGWCTTDIAYYAYGVNTYECFFQNKKPDWDSVFKKNKDVVYAMVIMNQTSNLVSKTKVFNYKLLEKQYSKILEIREIDYKVHSIYGFMFLAIHEEQEACFHKILQENFDQFLV